MCGASSRSAARIAVISGGRTSPVSIDSICPSFIAAPRRCDSPSVRRSVLAGVSRSCAMSGRRPGQRADAPRRNAARNPRGDAAKLQQTCHPAGGVQPRPGRHPDLAKAAPICASRDMGQSAAPSSEFCSARQNGRDEVQPAGTGQICGLRGPVTGSHPCGPLDRDQSAFLSGRSTSPRGAKAPQTVTAAGYQSAVRQNRPGRQACRGHPTKARQSPQARAA